MNYLIMALIAVALYWAVRKRLRRSPRRRSAPVVSSGVRPNIGIPMTAAESQDERAFNEKVFQQLERNLVASGYFEPARLPKLMADLRQGLVPFGRVSVRAAVAGDRFLDVSEKRALGLNSRRQYAARFIDYFKPECLSQIEPRSALENLFLDASHRMSRLRELQRFKVAGSVDGVTILSSGCAAAAKMKGRYNLDRPPELPRPDCEASFCGCLYQPVIKDHV